MILNLKKNKIKTFFIFLMLIFLFLICFPSFFSDYDPNYIDINNKLANPSKLHFLGTDILGRDIFTRILYGGRVSILLTLIATSISLFIGLIIGILAGYYTGILDIILTSITGIFKGLPSISIMIVIASFLGANIYSIILALTINSWMDFSRIVRSSVLKIKEENFIKIIRMYRATDRRIIFFHILPNILPDMIVLFTSKVTSTLLSIAGLSFLGIGVQPPTPDWGTMISDGMSFFITKPILVIAPGLAILIVSLGLNFLGEYLRNLFHIDSLEAI